MSLSAAGAMPGGAMSDGTISHWAMLAGRIRARDLLLVIALTAGLLVLMRLSIGPAERTVEIVIAMLAVQSLIPVAVIYLVVVRGRGLRWSELGLRPAPRPWYRRAVLIGLASLPLVALVNLTAQTLAGGPFKNPQLEVLAPSGFSWHGLAGMLAMAGVVAPAVEELVFRGLLYAWLRAHIGFVAGALASALVFSLVHGILILVPALAVQGVILAWLYERSGSLWPPIIMHGVFNMVMTSALYAALAAGVTLD